ncbi:MAG TPA: aspartate--tRNA ligase [Thermoanaerobaculia bacterium]|jgi:aspartyl-tRNA synthetase
MSRQFAGTLRAANAGESITLKGWVQKQRDFGELIFVDVRDRSGICQVVVDRERGAGDELNAIAKELRSEFVVQIDGKVEMRAEAQRNPKIATGDVELVATKIEVLSKSAPPPFPIEDDTDAAEELRLKYRYLDLRRPSLTNNLILRHKVAFAVRDFMNRNGFLEIETPMLTKSTPEGARDYLVPSRVHNGNFYALPQSPQIFKQLCMVAGLERYFQIARCFRDEDLRRDRQPEFTQVDIEASFIDEEFVFDLIERMFAEVFPLANIHPPAKFPRITWTESMNRFGIDRPDTRFGMELVDITDVAKTIEFDIFKAAAAIRAIVVPGGASFSRKRLDDIVAAAKSRGATLAWIKFDAQGSSSIKKFVTDPGVFRNALGANENDLALIVAGTQWGSAEVLGDLRLKIAAEEKLIPTERFDFLWVTDFPLFEWDEETQRYFARHHPFTSPALADIDKLENDQGNTYARAYDVVMNGLELGGGSIRINQSEVQSRMFRALGISDEDAQARFGHLLEAFRYGAPPHGGVALGLDRIVMLMARGESLREVIAYPKTSRAQDLMSDAPSPVDDRQLAELGIALRAKP